MSESRTKNTARNITFGTLNQVVTLLLNFINRTIFIKILGPEYLGINGLFSDILMMLSLADLGFGTAMIYSFYKPLAENDNKKVAALIKFYRKVYSIIASCVFVIGLTLVPFLRYIVNLESPIAYLEVYYLLFLSNTVISYLFVYKASIISADQKNYLISKYQMKVNFYRTVFQSLILLLTRNYLLYLFIQVIATFINNIIISRLADKLYPYLINSRQKLDRNEKKHIFENMKSIFIYKISGVLLTGTDNILISMMIGTIWVGIYSNYILVLTAINSLINIIYSSVTASIGNVIVTEKPKKLFEIFKSMQTVSLVISCFVTVCLYMLINDLINIWLGPDYILDDLILISIIFNFYLGSVIHPIWSYREATGLFVQTKYIMLFAAILNIFLSVLMGKYLGLAGIIFASSISRLVTYFWYEPNLLFRVYFEEKAKKYYIPLVINLLITILLIVVLKVLFNFFTIDTWYKFFIKIIIVCLITLITVIMVYRRTSGFKMVLT
ncbi:O-antigen/teichoic acid export membrane protein [Neobacillus niacini]|uniref:lipopolysaccharide biosynthesis protein n=1 Tax=Neobacillus niacini TaxID=86668 RepID=UPI0027885A1B|nr:oligosaccharide flippase family protein [Neobacillus niacini]MDQ1000340.1 O-antigen/teichoic acid export membrane protein [Neobacillus niacini]